MSNVTFDPMLFHFMFLCELLIVIVGINQEVRRTILLSSLLFPSTFPQLWRVQHACLVVRDGLAAERESGK